MFQESWEPQCLNGSVLTVSFGDYNQTVIAETCEDMLCPEGYACAMGPMFAHCCSNSNVFCLEHCHIYKSQNLFSVQAPSENSALSDSSDSDPLSVEKVGKLCSVALKTSKVQGDSPPPGTFIPSCTEEGKNSGIKSRWLFELKVVCRRFRSCSVPWVDRSVLVL